MHDSTQRDGGHPGVALTEKREQFARLIRQGVGNSEACRRVGINRRTGTRWRFGRTITNTAGEPVHYPPVTSDVRTRPRSPRYLSLDERIMIADLRRAGCGVRAIASELNRSPSTISRELRNNATDNEYRPHAAQRLAVHRIGRPRARLDTDAVLGAHVAQLLSDLKFSPEQVAHQLRVDFPGQRNRHLCPESIYQAIYDQRCGLTRPAKRSLRTGRYRRRRRLSGLERRGRLTNMTMIDQRPDEAADRSVPGHWEGDCIMGAGNKTAIGTLVERRSRYCMLIHLPGRNRAQELRDGIAAAMAALPPQLRKTLTWDQGKEMALHQQISAETGLDVFFCDAHSPWQRGSNENLNGLLRQYFPKSSDLGIYTPERLVEVASQLNSRPRKTLEWATPASLLTEIPSNHDRPNCCDVR
ncbi:IS30 family transposase (plasmid) [Rhodococcus sp. USK10]|uniref:IS30 family transposase n=1 Tax=Rhodococcus sp. USK10 TaxID=2789739 RepID=UPI001C5DD4E2|nr:IS30 family transposase [Rhodococcus sp. USK10]QYB00299.1 IS30 family transposase [Rhodococcus sp. USK10]